MNSVRPQRRGLMEWWRVGRPINCVWISRCFQKHLLTQHSPAMTFTGNSKGLQSFFFFFTFFFNMDHFSKVFIGFVTILLPLYVLVLEPWDTWDLSSWTRDGTCTPCTTGRRSLNPSPARRLSRAPVLKLICLSPTEPQVPESKSTTLEAISPGAVTTLPFPAKGQRGI